MQLKKHPRLRKAQTILLYYSLPDEVNTHEWIDEIVAEGKKVLLPVVTDGENMILREYTGKKDLKEGNYHILELGRGKGYYDRFLKKIPSIYKIGVCYSFQKESSIPYEKHDKIMDEIITDI